MREPTQPLEVTQADRVAAAEYVDANFATEYPHLAEAVRDGNAYPGMVQAFARHRSQAIADERAAALEEAAKVADHAWETTYKEPTDWDYGAQAACTAIARSIRALKGSGSHLLPNGMGK